MRILVCGAGAVGARAARHLVADAGTDTVLVHDIDRKRQASVVKSLGDRARAVDEPDPDEADLVLLASPAARQLALARRAVAAGRPVVSVADSLVSPGCVLHGTVEHSVLGPGVVVEPGAVVRDSVLLGGTVVRAGATVERAVLDERVRVEPGARVGGPAGQLAVVARGRRVPADGGRPRVGG